jgi:hypothetical protein
MINLDKEFLSTIGVEMTDEHYRVFLEHVDETLYTRIEDSIVRSLPPELVHELAELRNSDSETIWEWLIGNVPNLSEIIKTEVDAMLAEIVRSSDHL